MLEAAEEDSSSQEEDEDSDESGSGLGSEEVEAVSLDEDDEDGDSDEDDDDDDVDDMSESSDSQDEGSDMDDEESSEEDDALKAEAKERRLKFRQWATQQTSNNLAPNLLALNKPYVEGKASGPILPKIGPLGADYSVPSSSLLSRNLENDKKATDQVLKSTGHRPTLKRRPSVDESRQQLPVVAEEQSIMEAILLNPVVIICGETGSGKTTQIPQMLYEAGFGFKGSDNPGMVAVTQPRRVAAVSLAVRVASELNIGPQSKTVAHQIRYSSTTSSETAIKFMTDGVLLRELATDFLLSRYSVVVVDEAHERGVNTDVLVGVLSRVAKLREKLWREGKEDVKVRLCSHQSDVDQLLTHYPDTPKTASSDSHHVCNFACGRLCGQHRPIRQTTSDH